MSGNARRREKKPRRSMKGRRSYALPLLMLAIIGSAVAYYYYRVHANEGGMEILGHRYSNKLKTLYEEVEGRHGKRITIVERTTRADDSIDTNGAEIILTLGRGCCEDNVAHELMHAILHSEGYPRIFGIKMAPLSQKLHAVCNADLDHLIINRRLLDLGYDAKKGFLARADGYENILKLASAKKANSQAIRRFCLLSQLIKFHYYIADPNAEHDILTAHPTVRPYWETLSRAIENLPEHPTPKDLWSLGATYFRVGDTICRDVNAPFVISDLLGMGPMLLQQSDLAQPAKTMFMFTTQTVSEDYVLLRIFTGDPRVMVGCAQIAAKSALGDPPDSVLVRDCVRVFDIDHVILD